MPIPILKSLTKEGRRGADTNASTNPQHSSGNRKSWQAGEYYLSKLFFRVLFA